METEELIYIEFDPEFSTEIEEITDFIDANLSIIIENPVGDMSGIYAVKSGYVDDIIERLLSTSRAHATNHAEPLYMVGVVGGSSVLRGEVPERLYDNARDENTIVYRVLDDDGVNMENATVWFRWGLAFYVDDTDGYDVVPDKDFESTKFVPDADFEAG